LLVHQEIFKESVNDSYQCIRKKLIIVDFSVFEFAFEVPKVEKMK